jgi:hypothetical protein
MFSQVVAGGAVALPSNPVPMELGCQKLHYFETEYGFS